MISSQITDSDDFISLSGTAQALYIHLYTGADDDGFNNQVQMAMFKAHAANDDLTALLAKKFVLQFANGVIVIKHWRIANAIRKDRYTPTVFQEEFKLLKLKENGSYSWLTDGCQMVAVDKNSLDKSSIDKNNLEDDDNDNKARTREIIKSRWMEAGYTEEDVERVFSYMKGIDFTESNFKKIMLVLKERAVIDIDAYLVTMKKNGSLTAGKGDDHYEYCE